VRDWQCLFLLSLEEYSYIISFIYIATVSFHRPEFHKTIVAELDFTQKALNAERCNRMVGGLRVSTGNSLWGLWKSSS